MILMVSPLFMRTALPLPPGISVRSVFGLLSTMVAAAAEMHSFPARNPRHHTVRARMRRRL